MTGFFRYTMIDIPDLQEQLALVKDFEEIQQKIDSIEEIIKSFSNLLCKEIAG